MHRKSCHCPQSVDYFRNCLHHGHFYGAVDTLQLRAVRRVVSKWLDDDSDSDSEIIMALRLSFRPWSFMIMMMLQPPQYKFDAKKLILIHTFSGTWTYVPIQILISPTIPYRKVFWMERVIQNVGKTFLFLLLHMKEKLLAMVIEEHHWWLRKEESWTKTEHGQRGTKDHPSYGLFYVQNLLNDIMS